MKNSDYWRLRFGQLEEAQNKTGLSTYQEMERQYREAQKQIEGQISAWYQRFATNNGVSMAEARKMLTGSDLQEFKWDVNQYIQYGQENALMGNWTKELENASAKFHISRLEALKMQTQNSLETMFNKQLGLVSSTMGNVYESGYYHTAYELQSGFGIGWDIAGLDQSQVEKILSKPWAVDGKNFSERIWSNKEKLINEVHTELSRNILTGGDPQKAIDAIAKKMNTSKTNAGRLVMTEEAYFSSAAQKDCFTDLGVEQYEIVATLDSHTSEICQSLDGQVFPMKDYEPGVTAPPFHVNCRSTTVPYFDEDFGQIGERAARDEEGNTYYVPDNMNYQDWKETFVDGGDKSGFDVFQQNGVAHYKQHTEPETEKPKKEYLTKKKLQANIADADVQIEELENQFKQVSNGWTYEEAIADFGSLEDLADGDDLAKLKALKSDMDKLEAQKAEWETKLQEKLVAEQKKALVKEQMQLETQKAALEQQLAGMNVKTYSGIWKDDVTTADFSHLNIEGKKKYYEGKFITETDSALMQKYQDLYKQLQELETEGKAYTDVQTEINKIEQQLKKVQDDLTKVQNGGIMDTVDDTFSQTRKDAAHWFTDKNGGVRGADGVLRPITECVWKVASKVEKDAAFDYTQSYSKFNEPLRGIEYGTNKKLGVGNVDMDNIGVSYFGFRKGQVKKEIDDLTSMIDRAELKEDMWFQRGCRLQGMDDFFGVDSSVFSLSESKLSAILVNKEPTEYAFMSAGVAKGKGLNTSGGIVLNIYAPKGTKGLYLEPFSYYGYGVNGSHGMNGSAGRRWDGISGQSDYGQEAEILFQRGTKMRVIKVTKSTGTIYVDVEVIEQNAMKGVY